MMLEPLIDPAVLNDLSRVWAESMIALSVKGVAVLSLALASTWLLRRRAAAARHLIWNLAVISLLALPLVAALVPGLPVRGLPQVQLPIESHEEPVAFDLRQIDLAASGNAVAPVRVDWIRADPAHFPTPDPGRLAVPTPYLVSGSEGGDFEFSVAPSSTLDRLRANVDQWNSALWALLAWETISLLVLLWLGVGWVRALRLRNRCTPVESMNWRLLAQQVATTAGLKRAPRLLWSNESLTPLTIGAWRAAVILPRQAEQWSVDQRHDVLLHEFAHVQRRDILTQILAQVACATFWFHPLPWIAAGRMRLERERACDDRVLMAGSRASTYASHLLEMARSLRLESSLATATVAMARRSQLGERMESLLDHRERGRALGHAARGAALLLTLLLVLPLAAMRPAAAENEEPESPTAPDAPPQVHAPAPAHAVHRLSNVRVERHAATRAETGRIRNLLIAGVGVNGDQHSDEGDYTLDWDGGNFVWKQDGRSLAIEADGRIRFRPDETDVEWMEDGAFFEIDDRQNDERRRLSLDGRGDDGIERRYWLDGDETEFDEDGRQWFTGALAQFFDRSGVLTVSRVNRWVEEGGLDRALDETEDVGAWTLPRYGTALLAHTDSANERERVAHAVFGRLNSDHQRATFLQETRDDFFQDEASTVLWIDLAREIDSDFAKGQTLGLVVRAPKVSAPAIAMSLRAAEGIDSDFEKGSLLVGVADMDDLGEEVMLAALEAADELDSDFEKSRALIALIPHLDESDLLLDRFYEVADEMGSDFEYQKVLRALRAAGTD